MKLNFETKEEALDIMEQAMGYLRWNGLIETEMSPVVKRPVGRPRKALPYDKAAKRIKKERTYKVSRSHKDQKWQWIHDVHKLAAKLQSREELPYRKAFSKAAKMMRKD